MGFYLARDGHHSLCTGRRAYRVGLAWSLDCSGEGCSHVTDAGEPQPRVPAAFSVRPDGFRPVLLLVLAARQTGETAPGPLLGELLAYEPLGSSGGDCDGSRSGSSGIVGASGAGDGSSGIVPGSPGIGSCGVSGSGSPPVSCVDTETPFGR